MGCCGLESGDAFAAIPIRAGCEWKRVIGCTRFDTIKVWATGDRYAILSGETFKRFRGLP
jgi:hypothetical protein